MALGSDGGDEWPFSDSGMENVTEPDNQRVDGDTPLSPQIPPRPPSAGSQPKSPRTRRQRTLSQSAAAKAAVTTTNQVQLSGPPKNSEIDLTKYFKLLVQDFILRTKEQKTFYTAGRPPWYNFSGQHVEPFVIGRLYKFDTLSRSIVYNQIN